MNSIKKIPTKDMGTFALIGANAYPGMGIATPDAIESMRKRLVQAQRNDATITAYGYYRDGKLLGIMRHYDYTMQYMNVSIPVGGLGFVAVDLLHKKEKICKDLVAFYLAHYTRRKFPMAALYPFRPDFYRKMGFGYGTKISQYRFNPADLPVGQSKASVDFARKPDWNQLGACHDRYAKATHGMFFRTKMWQKQLANPKTKIVCYRKGRKIEGYLAFTFKKASENNFVHNNLEIIEFVYENREAFFQLVTFLRSQADQVSKIIYNVLDDSFHHLLFDPRNDTNVMVAPVYHESNTQGVGLMFRVLDIPMFFRAVGKHNFNCATMKLNIHINDTFCPANDGDHVVEFKKGIATTVKSQKTDCAISLDISDFSSMVMGAIDFQSLYDYGQAEISSADLLADVNRIFSLPRKPRCLAQF